MIKLPFLKAIILFAVTLTIVSCQPEEKKQEDAVIMGHYLPYDEHVFLNRVLSNKVDIIDSADLSNGEPFVFNVNTEDYLIHRLAHKELFPIMVIIRNGDTVEITQVDDKAWPYLVKGPPECMLLVEYLERLNHDHYKVDSLAAIFHYSQDHPDFIAIRDHLNNEFKRMLDEHKGEIEVERNLSDEDLAPWWLFRSIKPGLLARDVLKEHKIEPLRDYQHRSRRQINKAREKGERI